MAASDVPTIGGIPNTGNFTARFVEDKDNIAIIDLQGNYDVNLGDGKFNVEPRAVIAREFYKKHPDVYDFLVVFSSFEFDTDDALAFHHAVKRDVQGIGDRPLYNNTMAYGSTGRLQGFIDMAALSRYSTDPLNTDFDQVLQTFSHEFMHQWAAFARFKETNGTLSDALLKGDGHWSFLLDSDASLMYGHHWRNNGNGTFTSVKAQNHFSQLDLYLMGLIGKEEVPPMTLLVAPGEDKNRFPEIGVTITATPRIITIDDIIAAEGSRIPSVHDSQKDFRFAFIYVKRPGETVDTGRLTALSNIRREVGIRFNVLTRGLATANVFAEPTGAHAPGEPEVVVTEGPGQVLADSTGAALAWLGLQQKGTGEWGDTEATAVRDTAYALHAFRELRPASPLLNNGINWLQNKASETTDALARQIIAAHIILGASPEETYAKLLAQQNSDGGWGFATGYASNPLDTALAMQAIRKQQGEQAAPFRNARTWLVAQQNADGGWGNTVEGSSRVTATGQTLLALLRDGVSDAVVARAAEFIAGKQNADGGFGDSPSSQHDTAQTINTLMEAGMLGDIRVGDAIQYLAARQQTNGSWENSVYTTALAVRALNNARIMNWAIESFFAEPQTVADGLPVTLNLKIRNTGGVTAPATKIRVYDGDPETGGVPIRADVNLPQLGAGAVADVRIPWSTLGKAGEHTWFVVVDPDIEHQELTRDDNTASLTYTVLPAVAGIELLVTDADLSVTPQSPGQLPAQLTVSALLTNAGTLPANQVKVVLWEGRANQPKINLVGEVVIDMLPRATTPVQFAVTLNQGGRTVYTVEIDPENKIAESDKTNNTASITVSPESNLDLSVDPNILMEPEGEIRLGNDVSFTVRLRNNGTIDSPTAQVRYTIVEGSVEHEIRTNNVQLAVGQSIEQRIDWRTDREGGLIFRVQIDPQNLLDESDRTNNTAQKSFFVGERIEGSDLAINFKDITFDPDPGLEGSPLTIKALIRNIGTVNAGAFDVAFYTGIPNEGGIEIAERKTVSGLVAGESVEVVAIWENLDRETDQLIYVLVDPDQALIDVNRANNHALVILKVETLPDLAVSNGDITASPALPKPGDAVQISARITNFGQQTAENIVVRLYEGDPATGGQAVGEDQQIETLPTQASETVHFIYPMGSSAKTLYVVVDPDNLINERYKENNKASIALLSQDQDFYVSERYFSPNGDGIKDTTTLSFRLPEAMEAHIEVARESDGRVVRTSERLPAAEFGSWTWDGMTDSGTLARDDSYQMKVVTAFGAALGSATVELDNNRLPVLDAIGKPYGIRFEAFEGAAKYWGIDGYRHQDDVIISAADDSAHYLLEVVDAYGRYDYTKIGIFDSTGRNKRLITVPEGKRISSPWRQSILPNKDGSLLVVVLSNSSQGRPDELWVSDGEGKRQFFITSSQQPWNSVNLLAITQDNSTLIFRTAEAIWKVSLGENETPTKIDDTGYWERSYIAFSPDANRFLYRGLEDENVRLVDVRTGAVKQLPMQLENWDDGSNVWPVAWNRWVWSPDGRYFAGWAEIRDGAQKQYGLMIADRDGDLVYKKTYTSFNSWINYGTWDEAGEAFYFTEFENCQVTLGLSFYDCQDKYFRRVFPNATGNIEDIDHQSGNFFVLLERIDDFDLRQPESRARMGFYNGDAPGYQKLEPQSFLTRWQAATPIPGKNQMLYDGRIFDFEDPAAPKEIPFPSDRVPLGYHHDPDWRTGEVRPGFVHYFLGRLSKYDELIYLPEVDGYFRQGKAHVFQNAQNLIADLQVIRQIDGRSFKFRGTASDKNLLRFTLEYADRASPDNWYAIASASNESVINDTLAFWVPPAPGTYRVRLTVEDLAGNRKQVVKLLSMSAVAPLTGLRLTETYISPNGDGIQDTTSLEYRVRDLGTYEFIVENEQGHVVRTLLREETQENVDKYVVWDGRDENYQVVPDGLYRMTVLNYRFDVHVDNTPPAFIGGQAASQRVMTDTGGYWTEIQGLRVLIAPSTVQYYPELLDVLPPVLPRGALYTTRPMAVDGCPRSTGFLSNKGFWRCLTGTVEWEVAERNLRGVSLEAVIGDGLGGEERRERRNIDPGLLDTRTATSALWERGTWQAQGFWLSVEDKAGNRLVAEISTSVEEGLDVITVTEKQRRPDLQETVQTITHDTLSERELVETALKRLIDDYTGKRISLDRLRSKINELQNGSLMEGLKIFFELESLIFNIETLIHRPLQNLWFELDGVKHPLPIDTRSYEWQPPQASGEYMYRFVAETVDGREYASPFRWVLFDFMRIVEPQSYQELRFTPSLGTWSWLQLWGDAGTAFEKVFLTENRLAFEVKENLYSPGRLVEVYLQASQDVRYATPQRIGQFMSVSNETTGVASFPFLVRDNFLSCVPYTILVRVYEGSAPFGNRREFSKTVAYCDDIAVKANAQTAACGEAPDGKIGIILRPRTKDSTPIEHMVLGRIGSDGRDEIFFNVVNPVSGQDYVTEIDHNVLQQGDNPWFARMLHDGETTTRQITLIGDHLPLDLQIGYPQDGVNICANTLSQVSGKWRLNLQSAVSDNAGYAYLTVDTNSAGSATVTGVPAVFPSSYYYTIEKGMSAQFPGDISGGFKPGRGAGLVTPSYVEGDFGLDSGAYTAEVRVSNWAGVKVCKQVTFTIDAKVEADIRSDNRLFSPVHDVSRSVYQVNEPISMYVTVFPASWNAETNEWRVDRTRPVITLHNGTAIAAGQEELELFWDGYGGDGNIVTDGHYLIDVEFRDTCNNRKGLLNVTETISPIYVEVDATPPHVVLRAPQAGQLQSMLVGIVGDVSDKNLESWTLTYALGTPSEDSDWLPLAKGTTARDNELLASWNTYGLIHGDYTLRLVAVDKAGNRAETHTVVTVGDQEMYLLIYAEALPLLFSPNGDGRLDQTTLRFGLDQASWVTVDVLGGNITPRRLLDRTVLTAGGHVLNWDGRDGGGQTVPDGEYTIRITAELANDLSVRQEESVSVTVDNTAPLLTLISPTGSVIKGSTAVIGSIADKHPGVYQVTVVGPLPSSSIYIMEEGEGAVSVHRFGDFSVLPEGSYTLTLTATDRAENTASRTLDIEIDNTPPAVAIQAPVTGSYLGGSVPILVTGSVVEKHPRRWTLSMGQGPPENWTILSEGSTLPLPGDLNFVPAHFADGTYTLRLYAEDLAGWNSAQDILLIIDNTPPTAQITRPTDGAVLRAATDVAGLADDANFKEYWLEVAPGRRDEASRWTRIAEGNSPASYFGTLPLLSAGTYTLKLTVVDKAGNVSTAEIEVVFQEDPSTAPITLTATVENQTQVRLNWTASTDSGVIGYRIERNGTRIVPTPLDALTYLDGAPGEGKHTYRVYAVNQANQETASNPATVTIGLGDLQTGIISPAAEDRVSGQIDILGTAYSASYFKEYRLSVGAGAAPAEEDYQLLQRSALAIRNNVLGQWDTRGLPEGAEYTIRLEAEDTLGYHQEVLVTVVVDNLPPAKPTGLTAVPDSNNNVTLTWNPNTEPDLDGYLLFRDGVLVNASAGSSVDTLRPYIIKGTTYLDRSVPDGDYVYTVEAIDTAGNISEPSDPAMVTLRNKTPRAVIVEPLNGTRINQRTYLLAMTEDRDIAYVQIEFRARGSTVWQAVGEALTREPYGVYWDPQTLSHGVYEFRAVATDVTNRTDPQPPVISLVYSDELERTLTARVDGGDVNLRWTPSASAAITGYSICRGTPSTPSYTCGTVIVQLSANETTYTDSGVDDGQYIYSVDSRRANGVTLDETLTTTAIVYTPVLKQPFTPIAGRSTLLEGRGLPQVAEVTVTVTNEEGEQSLEIAPSNVLGDFASPQIVLATGDNRISVVMNDEMGNRSRAAKTHVMTGDAPAAPQNLAGSSNGSAVTLGWTANSEADLWGYLIEVDGMLQDVPWSGGTTSTNYYYDITKEAWLVYQMEAPAQVTQVTVAEFFWNTDGGRVIPDRLSLEGWDGEVWVPLKEIRDNTQTAITIDLGDGYRTDRLRLRFYVSATTPEMAYGSGIWILFQARHAPVITAAHWAGEIANGNKTVAVRAVSLLGLVGAASSAVMLDINGETLLPPENLTVQPNSWGRPGFVLNWQAPVGGKTPTNYDIYRSTTAGGPYTLVGNCRVYCPPSGDAVDPPFESRYYYVVRSKDDLGNISDPSNEASGVLGGTEAGIEIFFPATWNIDAYWGVDTAPVIAYAFPGATIRLFNESSEKVGTAEAAPAVSELRLPMTGVQPDDIQWSPDGSLYIVRKANGFSLYKVVSDNQAPVLLKEFTNRSYAMPKISFDNKYIAFHEVGVIKLYRMSSDTFIDKWLSDGSLYFIHNNEDELAWSPRGDLALKTEIVLFGEDFTSYEEKSAIWLLRAETMEQEWAENDLILYSPALPEGLQPWDYDRFGQLAWSPNGKYLAYLRTALTLEESYFYYFPRYTLETISIDSKTVTPIDDVITPSGKGVFTWSPYGETNYWDSEGLFLSEQRIYYLKEESYEWGTLTPVIKVYHIGAERSGEVFFYSPYHYDTNTSVSALMVFDESGWDTVVMFASGAIFINRLNSTIIDRNDFFSLSGKQIRSLEKLPSGYLIYTRLGEQVRRTPVGLVRFEGVPLPVRKNTFSASIFDEPYGYNSVVIYTHSDAHDRPDLSIRSEDIVSLPGVPWLGETARISAKVWNSHAVAPTADIVVSVKDPQGRVSTLYRGSLPPLYASRSVSTSTLVSMDWTPSVMGAHEIVISIDPDNRIAEVRKDNNVAARSFTVMQADAAVSMSLALDGNAYQAQQNVTGTFTLFNGGGVLNGTLKVSIEDEDGYLVTQLPAIAVAQLASGAQRNLSAVWNTGNTLSGTYRMRGVLLDTGDSVLAETMEAFAINTATLTADARLVTDREAYTQGSTVQFYGTVDFAGFLPGQVSIPSAIIVYNSADQEIYRYTQMLSPSSQVDVRTSWTTGSAATGNYRAVLVVGDENHPLAQATANFALNAVAVATHYEGDLTLAAAQVRLGHAVQAQAVLRNTGGLAIMQLPVLITVIDPQGNHVLAQERRVIDLPLGASETINVAFSTNNWPLRRLNVLLQIEASIHTPDGQTQTLQQRPVALFEDEPPIVAILQPADGIIVRSVPTVVGTAYDLLSGLRSVEYRLNGGSWIGMLLSNPLGNVYSAPLPVLTDGEHQLMMRATDDFSNTGMSSPVSFIIDTIPPEITITGVAQGGNYSTAVTPVITVTDLHLDTTVITLNGQPFVSGTALSAEGSYVLVVVATDKAGNQSTETVTFAINHGGVIIDTTPPVVTITRPVANTYLKTAGNLEATIVDAESGVKDAEYRIDSGSWTALPQVGTPTSHYQAALGALADGVYTVSARATDNADNVSQPVSVAFTVDATPPEITITGVAQDGAYTAPVTPVIVIYDLNLDTSSITLNGNPFTSGTEVSVHAHYVLMATATDKAGNQTTVSRSFELKAADTTPPVVTITRPVANTYLKTAGNLEATIVDDGSGVRDAEYRIGSGDWDDLPQEGTPDSHYQVALGALVDGIYTVSARATDNAGNVSQPVSVAFTVDATPPEITIMGVAQNGAYTAPVTPVIVIYDLNLDTSSVTLNGNPFTSGTEVSAQMSYALMATATDKAGNQSTQTVTFTIGQGVVPDTTPPVVTITRPVANTYLKTAGNLEATIVDDESGVKNAEYRIGSGNWNVLPQVRTLDSHYQAALGMLADGVYTVSARATDNADNVSQPVSVNFTVDATPPQIIIAGVENQRDYAEAELPLMPVITIIELNPDTEIITLDGRPFVPGTTLSDAGTHVLYVEAIDKAGNRSERTVRFTLLGGSVRQGATPIPLFVFTPWLLLWYSALLAVFLMAVRRRFRGDC